MKILAIDPGGTTGIAAWFSPGLSNEFVTFTTSTPEQLWTYVSRFEWDIVLCERFKTAGRISKYGLYTVELVGGVRALCHLQEKTFLYREPGHRKAWQAYAQTYLEDYRRATGTTFVVHEADALAHLMAHLKWSPPK